MKQSERCKTFSNVFGAERTRDNTDKSISRAREKAGAIVNDYTAAPIYFSDSANGAHEWLIEFEKEPGDFVQFTTELDEALKQINSDYEAKRNRDIALQKTLLHSLRKGIFSLWLRKKGKLGGQQKLPR